MNFTVFWNTFDRRGRPSHTTQASNVTMEPELIREWVNNQIPEIVNDSIKLQNAQIYVGDTWFGSLRMNAKIDEVTLKYVFSPEWVWADLK